MRYLSIVLLASAVYGQGIISGGIVPYEPKLEQVQEQYGVLESEKEHWYVSLLFPVPDKEYWVGGYYIGYQGTNDRLDLTLHNIGLSYHLVVPADSVSTKFKVYIGGGPNLYYMRREFDFGTHNDYLYGLNGMVGLNWRALGPLGFEVKYIYQWCVTSTIGGTEYDLSDKQLWYGASLSF